MSSNIQPPSFFILGATGFIGGALFIQLLSLYPTSTFRVLYRNPSHLPLLQAALTRDQSLRVVFVQGNLSDSALLIEEASEAVITINSADADGLATADALLAGLEKKFDGGRGTKGIFLHTTGSAELWKFGATPGEGHDEIVDDSDVQQLRDLPISNPHRPVTVKIADEIAKGYFTGAIVSPGTVYAPGFGPINKTSIQFSYHARYALAKGQVRYVGSGTNIWNGASLLSVLDLYTRLLKYLLSSPPTPSNGWERYFHATGEQYTWKEVSEAMAKILFELGAIKYPNAISVKLEDVEPELLGGGSWSQSNGLATRSIALLGWKADGHWEDQLEEEMKLVVRKWRMAEELHD